MKKYYIKTFGCQMNVYDSQRIAAILKSLGYAEASSLKNADLVILNTCHIREKPQKKSFRISEELSLSARNALLKGLIPSSGLSDALYRLKTTRLPKEPLMLTLPPDR